MNLFKTCPKCLYPKCWHLAPVCEKCGLDFKKHKKPLPPYDPLQLRLTPRVMVRITQEQYDDTLQSMLKFINDGMSPDDAADLAVHQLRLVIWIETKGKERRQKKKTRHDDGETVVD